MLRGMENSEFGRFVFLEAKEAQWIRKPLVVEVFVIGATVQRARDATGPNPRGVLRYPRLNSPWLNSLADPNDLAGDLLPLAH
jgi:hypothetical protein